MEELIKQVYRKRCMKAGLKRLEIKRKGLRVGARWTNETSQQHNEIARD